MVDGSSVGQRDRVMSSLDYSLQLLFLASQVDMTWDNTYSMADEKTDKEKKRQVTVKKKKDGHVMLMPRLKKSFLSILKATKYKLANTCLLCVRQSSEEIEIADVSCRKENEVCSGFKSENVNGNEEGENTLIKTIYNNDCTSSPLKSELNIEDLSGVVLQTIADGRQCFRESRQFASRGIQEVKSLSDTVSSIQKSLQFALNQLCWVEYGLNDCRWESVDRETWTQTHFLSSVGTFTSLLPDRSISGLNRSRFSLDSDVLFCDLDYSWDD